MRSSRMPATEPQTRMCLWSGGGRRGLYTPRQYARLPHVGADVGLPLLRHPSIAYT
jgi:hypothetical protein